MTTPKRKLRSTEWFGTADKNGFMYRSWMKNQGIPDHEFRRPARSSASATPGRELTPCNAHFRKIAEHVKRGIYEAGGFPVEFPVFSNGESNLRPTAMLTRNLASMDVEESIRGNPIDGVVLLVGCDKTTPALLMGAASCDMPAIVVTGGPMLNGKHRGPRHRLRHRRVAAARSRQGRARSRSMNSWRPRPACRARPAPATPWARPPPWPAWPRRWAPRCRTTPRFRRSTRAATCWRTCRACASWRW